MIAHPSPNFGPRRDGLRPSLIVLHYTAMQTARAALERLCDPVAEVSAHYLICEQGQIYSLVAEDMRAWHAGAGRWQGQGDINSRSIGIELANCGTHPFAHAQISALETLLHGIVTRWGIPPSGVIGHSDMAPGRKIDPGPRFDWQRLARQGLSVWPDDQPGDELDLANWPDLARALGYDIPENAPTDPAFHAFRARFRPWKTGPCDREDIRITSRLLLQRP